MINKKNLALILICLILAVAWNEAKGAIGASCSSTVPCGAEEECRCGKCEAGCSGSICIKNPLCSNTMQELIESLINVIFWLAVIIVPLMIIIGAFCYATSGGSPDKIRTAKNIMLYAAIGFVIIMLAKAIMSVIQNIFGG